MSRRFYVGHLDCKDSELPLLNKDCLLSDSLGFLLSLSSRHLSLRNLRTCGLKSNFPLSKGSQD
jgi:hypothetical protein